jgi:hypothetical protein
MSDVSNLRDTIVPKSESAQHSEQLLYGPLTITVTSVARGSDDQPIIVTTGARMDAHTCPANPCARS